MRTASWAFVAFVIGCGDDAAPLDAGRDAARASAPHDAAADVAMPVVRDAATDAGHDAAVADAAADAMASGPTDAGACHDNDAGDDDAGAGVDGCGRKECTADLILAVDSSPSLGLYLDTIGMALNEGLKGLRDVGIDLHVVVISSQWMTDPIFATPIVGDSVVCIESPIGSGDCSDDSNPPGYQHLVECPGDCFVASHNSLGRLIGAYPYYQGALRKRSLKYFATVTDDTAGDTVDYAGQAAMFTSGVAGLDAGWFDDWKFFALINPSTGGAYQMLADQTGGVTGEISANLADHALVFDMLTDNITTALNCP